MEKVIVLSLGLFVLTTCNNQKKIGTENQSEITTVGGEKNEHGCIAATGETWSELRQECLRLFEKGIRLNPIEVKKGEAIMSAFAVFNDDKSKIEIFIPNEKNSIILEKFKSEENVYRNDNFMFDVSTSVLYINGEKKFVADKK